MTYEKIMGLRTVETFGGATFNVAEGVPNPWNTFAYLAALVLIVFVVDASVRLWRRGGRRRAVVVGGGVTLFFLLGGVHTRLGRHRARADALFDQLGLSVCSAGNGT